MCDVVCELLPLDLSAQQGTYQAVRVEQLSFEHGFAMVLQSQGGEPAQGNVGCGLAGTWVRCGGES